MNITDKGILPTTLQASVVADNQGRKDSRDALSASNHPEYQLRIALQNAEAQAFVIIVASPAMANQDVSGVAKWADSTSDG